jgi:hypothetical protein
MSARPVIKLTEQLQKAMAEQMAAGDYGSEEAMMLDALQALADRRKTLVAIEAGLAQRHFRADALSDPAESFTRQRLVEFERIAPKRFIPKRVETEDLSAFLDHLQRIALRLR